MEIAPRSARLLLILLILLPGWPILAEELLLEPARDTTIYFDDDGDLANGVGQHLFTGRGNDVKRALLAFDLTSIPAGATIEEVELTLYLSRTIVPGIMNQVYRVERDWGEGASDALAQEGAGGTSAPGDATWIHRFFDTELWTDVGGDVAVEPSAALLIADDIGDQVFTSTPALIADVQGWVDDPANNFGWQVRGLESFLLRSAKRFDSREHPDPNRRPRLRVVFAPPPIIAIPTLSQLSLALLAALILVAGLGLLRQRI